MNTLMADNLFYPVYVCISSKNTLQQCSSKSINSINNININSLVHPVHSLSFKPKLPVLAASNVSPSSLYYITTVLSHALIQWGVWPT